MRLIDADALSEMMYHEAFETDSDMQKWDSGCWIRYKMFENCIDAQPTIEIAPIVRCKNCKNLFSCYKWPTEDILNNFCQDGDFGENGYETD